MAALYRYKSTYDQYSGVTTLTIYNLREEDEGEYTCKAINSLGEASTSATLLSQGLVCRSRRRSAAVWLIAFSIVSHGHKNEFVVRLLQYTTDQRRITVRVTKKKSNMTDKNYYYYYTCIYNAHKFSNDTESEALAVTRWAAW